jgi:hypothetical protein
MADDTDDAAGGRTDPFDPSRLRLSQKATGGLSISRALATVPVRRPNPQEFFRVHADPAWRLDTLILEVKADREVFLVAPELWAHLAAECKTVTLYATIDRRQVVTLWPVRLPDDLGRLDDWSRSAHDAAERATWNWVRLTANMGLGAYEIDIAKGAFGDPPWPADVTFAVLLAIAFRGRMIDSLDHPAVRRLRGDI